MKTLTRIESKVTTVTKPDSQETLQDPQAIKDFLSAKGIFFDQWAAPAQLSQTASQEEVLAAYADQLNPYMETHSYQTADVVNLHAGIENYPAIRAKFLSEHTHTEDEVRFFVDGQGLFWFNLEGEEVFSVLCCKGDLLSVPKGTKHWFDAGLTPDVKAIRIFSDTSGWTPEYTGSDITERYSHITL